MLSGVSGVITRDPKGNGILWGRKLKPKLMIFFLLARLLFVHYAPVSERAKACKKAKGTRNKPKTESKTEPDKQTTKAKNRSQTSSLCSW